nr:mechanosensitive ion channel [Saprospiraceae bacterium]
MRKIWIGIKALFLLGVILVRILDLWEINQLFEDNKLIAAIFMGLVYLISVELIKNIILFLYRKKKALPLNKIDNFTLGIRNVFMLLYIVGFIFILLSITGIQLSSFVFSMSIVAAAVAIVSKEHFNDIISSMLVTFSSEIEVGDRIKIGEFKGIIQSMTLSKTTILTEDDDLIYIPNGKLFTSEVVNYTKRAIKKTSITFELSHGLVKDLPELEERLKKSVVDFEKYFVKGTFNLWIVDLKKDYTSFKVQYVLKKVDIQMERDIRRAVIRSIYGLTTQAVPHQLVLEKEK